jgi:hypothetical protein
MKKEILEAITRKKQLFKQELSEGAMELKKIRDEISKLEKKEGALIMMERLPILKTKIVSAKVVIAVLMELEKEVNEAKPDETETTN